LKRCNLSSNSAFSFPYGSILHYKRETPEAGIKQEQRIHAWSRIEDLCAAHSERQLCGQSCLLQAQRMLTHYLFSITAQETQ
jgi:hypothetical protein